MTANDLSAVQARAINDLGATVVMIANEFCWAAHGLLIILKIYIFMLRLACLQKHSRRQSVVHKCMSFSFKMLSDREMLPN